LKSTEKIYIVEGEKDVENLQSLGLTATTNPGGAGKWRTEYNEYLRNRDVVIIPDNDDVGKKHAENIFQNLRGIAKSVKILQLPGLPEKGDVSDWLNAGGTNEELEKLADNTQEYQHLQTSNSDTRRIIKASELGEPKPLQWLILGILPRGVIVILYSDSGEGKSDLTIFWAILIAAGMPFFKWKSVQNNVVYIDFEMGKDELNRRITAFCNGLGIDKIVLSCIN
jgi:hypothetical protein